MAADPTLTVLDLATGEARALPRDTQVLGFPHAYRLGDAYRVGRWLADDAAQGFWTLGPAGVEARWAALLGDPTPLAAQRGHVVLLRADGSAEPEAGSSMTEAVLRGVPAAVAYVLTRVETVEAVRAWLASASRHPAGRPPNVTDLLRARRRAKP